MGCYEAPRYESREPMSGQHVTENSRIPLLTKNWHFEVPFASTVRSTADYSVSIHAMGLTRVQVEVWHDGTFCPHCLKENATKDEAQRFSDSQESDSWMLSVRGPIPAAQSTPFEMWGM